MLVWVGKTSTGEAYVKPDQVIAVMAVSQHSASLTLATGEKVVVNTPAGVVVNELKAAKK